MRKSKQADFLKEIGLLILWLPNPDSNQGQGD